MSWSERVLPWLSQHALSLILLLCLIVLASVLFSLTFNRRISSVISRPQNIAPCNPADIGHNTQIAHAIKRYLHEKKNVGLSAPPTARLIEDIGLTQQELITATHDLLTATGRGYGSHIPGISLTTVGDLIYYVQNAPQITN
jgi:hypothetical protein